jgi:NADPH:quinone reductase
MRAVRCEAYGPPSGLVLREVPDPVAEPGAVVVEVHAAGVNFPDVLLIANRYQVPTPLPFIPGNEFAGRVLEVGPDVTGIAVGDLVMGTAAGGGAFAERIAVPARALRPVPDGLDLVHAAAFGVTYRTAYHSLVTIGEVRPDDWVVVLGAAGGVGTACVDIASRLGARVIAAVGSRDRLAVGEKLGAVGGIVYSEEDLKTAIRRFTASGADVVIDPVGGPYAEQALRSTRWGGRFVCVGFATGEIPRIPLNLVLLKGVIVRGFELRTLADYLPGAIAAEERALAGLVGEGMRPEVSECYRLEAAAVALERVAGRQATGKIVIAPTIDRVLSN